MKVLALSLFLTLLSLHSFAQSYPFTVVYIGIDGSNHSFTAAKARTKFSLKMDAEAPVLSLANEPDPAKYFHDKIVEKLSIIYGSIPLEIPRIESFALQFAARTVAPKTSFERKRSIVVGQKLLVEFQSPQGDYIFALLDTVGTQLPVNVFFKDNGVYKFDHAALTALAPVRSALPVIAAFISKNKAVKVPAISIIAISGQDKIYLENSDGSTDTIDVSNAEARTIKSGLTSAEEAMGEDASIEAILSPSTALVNSVEINCTGNRSFEISTYSDTGKLPGKFQVELVASGKKKVYQFNENISLADFKRAIFADAAVKSLNCVTSGDSENALTGFYYQTRNAMQSYQTIASLNKQIEDLKKDTTKSNIWNNITLLNAANFDFSENITGTYLAKLNIFAPDIRKTPFGFNAGIMRTKFSNKDSANSQRFIENRLINPLDIMVQDKPYVRKYNQYTSTLSNTSWSFYLQPMLRLVSLPTRVKVDKKKSWSKNNAEPNGIFLHLHAELLVNKVNITTNITALQTDTVKYDVVNPPDTVFYRPDILIYDRTYLEGYFGIGVTINVDPFGNDNSRFFLQATYGTTSGSPNIVSQDLSQTIVRISDPRSAGNRRGTYTPNIETYRFYLLRTHFMQKLSSNAQLVIGTDIRGLLPKYNPVYASYVGLNLNLDALVKAVTK